MLLGKEMPNLHFFIVDEFQRLNGFSEEQVVSGRAEIIAGLKAIGDIFGSRNPSIISSEMMGDREYGFTYMRVSSKVRGMSLERELMATVPERYRGERSALSYPLHEVACVAHLAGLGFKTKIGPTTERRYDQVIESIGTPISFNYLTPAYALGLQEEHEVVHYSPNHLPKGGQRILLDDPDVTVRNKVMQGNESAVRALGSLAVAAATARGSVDERAGMLERAFKKPMKKAVARMVLDNIVRPYREMRYGR